MRLFRSPIPFYHAPRKMGHGGVPLPLRYLPAALRLHDAVNGDLTLMPEDGIHLGAINEPCTVKRLGIKEREFLLYGFLQSGAHLPVCDRVMREVRMEPRPCGLPLLRLHVVPARCHRECHILPDLPFQVFRMNPIRRIIGMGIVAVHHGCVAGKEVIIPTAASPELPAHMVERHDLQAVVLVIHDALFRVQAVLLISPAVRHIKCHFHTLHTSSQPSVK